MPASIESEPNDVYVLRISGMLKRSEFATQQDLIARRIVAGARPRMLVILEDFQGWERRVDWNDFDFLLAHGDEIARISIVSEPRWEAHALAFAGAGVRRAPVKLFPPDEVEAARAWVAESTPPAPSSPSRPAGQRERDLRSPRLPR